MRLDRLDLVRYGKFTDRSLDFGEARPGRPDFHLVHGPNEAGKSTLFSAYLDLLFGIEKSSAYGFLHPYPVMRVGGRLTIGSQHHEAYRLKRNQASLVAADDRPLPDGLFASVLGGMDRAAYRTMFSLDDESIEKGGEDILRSEGELGAMLFSASSGLSDMASGLAALKAEADEFYRPQGRKHGLAVLKAEIDALREERKALDVAARDYAVLVRERDAAARRHEELSAARAEVRAALAALERNLSALPHLRRLRALRAELGAFDLGEPPPPGWRALTGELAREEAEIAARAARVEAERDRWSAELSALAEDHAVLALEADVASLSGSPLEARFRTAAMDLASREAERDRLTVEIAERLAALGLPADSDPAGVVLPPGLADRLTAHLSRRSALVERSAAARRELADAGQALEAARKAAGTETEEAGPADEGTLAALGAILRTARSGNLSGRLREAHRLRALAAAAAGAALSRLAPWSGEAEALEAMTVPPPGVLDDLRTRGEAAREASRRLREQAAALELDLGTRRAALDALLKVTGALGGAAAGTLRSAREAAWQRHLARLDAESAGAFEKAMRDDDRAVETLLRNADRLSEIRLLEKTVAEAAARLDLLHGEAGRLVEAERAVAAEVAALAESIGLPAASPLEAVETWLERRDEALAQRANLERQRVEAGLVEAEARDVLARLDGLLARALPQDAGLDEALLLAEDRLAAWRETRAARLAAAERLARAEAEAEGRREKAEAAAEALAAWEGEWTREIAGTWLATEQAPAEPERLGALLPALQALLQRVERRGEYDHRIASMRRDQEDYGRFVHGLAERLAMAEDEDPLAVMAAIAARLEAARAARQRRQDIEASLARLDEEEAALGERRAVLAARLSEIFAFLGCGSIAEADVLLEAHRRREEVRARIEDAARDLVRQMGAETVEEAEAQLAAVDEAELAARRGDLAARLEECDREVQEAHAARARAEDALSRVAGGDDAAALEERRRTALLDIAEKSRRYLATRAGVMAAEQALRLYRERHRSAMMEHASRTFRAITGGEYTGLSTILEKDSEFLVVNAAVGGSKLARDLSKGTRFQLYLALRVAGYREIAASREIVPFIADDIMETFDDRRALNALRVLGEMALGGQVIYLTHHQHLRDLAREACPEVTVHEL